MLKTQLQFGYGNHSSPVRTNRALLAHATGQRESDQPQCSERHPVRGRARLQVAGASQALRQLAHDLYAHEPLEQERCARPGVRATAASPDRAHQDRGGVLGQHHGEGSSRWDRGAKKNGPQAIGKSRGGWTTKIHLVAADARTAITFALSPGQAHDAPEGRALLNRLGKPGWPIHLLMDRAYEGEETRQLALDLGFIPVVPPKSNRITPWEYDREMDQAPQRDRAPVSPAQGLPAPLLPVQETRRDVRGLHSFRVDRRRPQVVLTGLSRFSVQRTLAPRPPESTTSTTPLPTLQPPLVSLT